MYYLRVHRVEVFVNVEFRFVGICIAVHRPKIAGDKSRLLIAYYVDVCVVNAKSMENFKNDSLEIGSIILYLEIPRECSIDIEDLMHPRTVCFMETHTLRFTFKTSADSSP